MMRGIERAYERGMQEGLDLRDALREEIASLTERLGDRDQDLKIVNQQLAGAVQERDTFARALRLAVASPELREAYVRQAKDSLWREAVGE